MFAKLKQFYSREDINVGRQKNIDYAKAIAIFGMILVHVFLYPYYAGFNKDGLSYFIGYILGGFMAAPVFMVSMGIGLAYSKNNEPKQIIIRGFKLIGMHYVLNILRSIYTLIAVSPYADDVLGSVIYSIFNGDILVFAGLALILFGLLKMIKKNSNLWILVTALIFIAISSIFKIKNNDNAALAYTLGLLIPVDYCGEPVICFQLCSWFIFVAFGYLLGITIKKIKNLDKFYLISGIIGAVIATTLLLLDYFCNLELYFVTYTVEPEYMVGAGYAFIALGIVFFEFAVLHFFCKLMPEGANKAIYSFSGAINEIYIVSWLIILNISFPILRPFVGETPMNPAPYFILFIFVFPFSTILGLMWKEAKKNKAQKQINEKQNWLEKGR